MTNPRRPSIRRGLRGGSVEGSIAEAPPPLVGPAGEEASGDPREGVVVAELEAGGIGGGLVCQRAAHPPGGAPVGGGVAEISAPLRRRLSFETRLVQARQPACAEPKPSREGLMFSPATVPLATYYFRGPGSREGRTSGCARRGREGSGAAAEKLVSRHGQLAERLPGGRRGGHGKEAGPGIVHVNGREAGCGAGALEPADPQRPGAPCGFASALRSDSFLQCLLRQGIDALTLSLRGDGELLVQLWWNAQVELA